MPFFGIGMKTDLFGMKIEKFHWNENWKLKNWKLKSFIGMKTEKLATANFSKFAGILSAAL